MLRCVLGLNAAAAAAFVAPGVTGVAAAASGEAISSVLPVVEAVPAAAAATVADGVCGVIVSAKMCGGWLWWLDRKCEARRASSGDGSAVGVVAVEIEACSRRSRSIRVRWRMRAVRGALVCGTPWSEKRLVDAGVKGGGWGWRPGLPRLAWASASAWLGARA